MDPHGSRGSVIETERHFGATVEVLQQDCHHVSGTQKMIVSFSLNKESSFQMSVAASQFMKFITTLSCLQSKFSFNFEEIYTDAH